jgi:hypothetical protein
MLPPRISNHSIRLARSLHRYCQLQMANSASRHAHLYQYGRLGCVLPASMGQRLSCLPLVTICLTLIACQAATNTYKQFASTMSRLAHPSNPSAPGGNDFGACWGKWPPFARPSCMIIRTNVAINSTTLIQLRFAIQSSALQAPSPFAPKLAQGRKEAAPPPPSQTEEPEVKYPCPR